PPRPTLLPYTTLFRSHELAVLQLLGEQEGRELARLGRPRVALAGGQPEGVDGDERERRPAELEVGPLDHVAGATAAVGPAPLVRSEEHTSELQSRENL